MVLEVSGRIIKEVPEVAADITKKIMEAQEKAERDRQLKIVQENEERKSQESKDKYC